MDDVVGIGDRDLHNVAHSIVESMNSPWTPIGTLWDHNLAGISRHRCGHDDQMDSCSLLCERVRVLGKGIRSLEVVTNPSQARLMISNQACRQLENKLVDDDG
jgi:hypothetical protein